MTTPTQVTPQVVSESDMQALQAEVVGVPARIHRTVDFKGQKFRMAEKISHIVLMRFAHAADRETDTDDIAAMSAMYELLKDCIWEGVPPCGECATCKTGALDSCPSYKPGDWKRFERVAIKTKADTDDLMPVVEQVIEVLMARPTEQPSPSSNGVSETSRNSTETSSGVPAVASNS